MFRKLTVTAVTMDELLEQSDFVSLNVPLTKETRQIIGKSQLEKMKPTAYLINCGRGELIDEQALYQALRTHQIAGAGLDVLTEEPPAWNHPLLTLETVVVSPHLGFYSEYSGQRQLQVSIDNLVLIFNGEWPKWFVNPEVKTRYLKRFGKP
jgi:phosphoglycerate dehydrogenase-like enzyme